MIGVTRGYVAKDRRYNKQYKIDKFQKQPSWKETSLYTTYTFKAKHAQE